MLAILGGRGRTSYAVSAPRNALANPIYTPFARPTQGMRGITLDVLVGGPTSSEEHAHNGPPPVLPDRELLSLLAPRDGGLCATKVIPATTLGHYSIVRSRFFAVQTSTQPCAARERQEIV